MHGCSTAIGRGAGQLAGLCLQVTGPAGSARSQPQTLTPEMGCAFDPRRRRHLSHPTPPLPDPPASSLPRGPARGALLAGAADGAGTGPHWNAAGPLRLRPHLRPRGAGRQAVLQGGAGLGLTRPSFLVLANTLR